MMWHKEKIKCSLKGHGTRVLGCDSQSDLWLEFINIVINSSNKCPSKTTNGISFKEKYSFVLPQVDHFRICG
jgi:hypothetical protein